MSTVLLVVCHPRPGSFCHALADRVREALEGKHTLYFHDLYVENFDPVLRLEELDRRFSFDPVVQSSYRELAAADGIVLVHPDWWGRPPALLSGWVDRVFRPGVAYEFTGEDFEVWRKSELLAGKKAQVFCTSDLEREVRSIHPLVKIWRDSVFGYCGAEAEVRVFHPLRGSRLDERERWLKETAAVIRRAYPA